MPNFTVHKISLKYFAIRVKRENQKEGKIKISKEEMADFLNKCEDIMREDQKSSNNRNTYMLDDSYGFSYPNTFKNPEYLNKATTFNYDQEKKEYSSDASLIGLKFKTSVLPDLLIPLFNKAAIETFYNKNKEQEKQ